MATRITFLTPGQRYAKPGISAWRTEDHITIIHVGRWGDGVTRVTYRRPDGGEITGEVAGLEAAVLEGKIVPIAADGWPVAA